MLFLHEVHEVVGSREDEFEAAFRDGWMPMLARGMPTPGVLWYCDHAVGSGMSYSVVTITGVHDGTAWERLACSRLQAGDLHDWLVDVDTLRHDVRGKVLLPLPWSPMQDVDLATVPADGSAEHELTVYMEDTMWPYEGQYPDYVKASGRSFDASMLKPKDRAPRTRRSSGSKRRSSRRSAPTSAARSALMQRILDPDPVTRRAAHDRDSPR